MANHPRPDGNPPLGDGRRNGVFPPGASTCVLLRRVCHGVGIRETRNDAGLPRRRASIGFEST
jgi:hypothetical protein